MPPSPSSSPFLGPHRPAQVPVATALAPSEVADAEQLARRLTGELRALVGLLPEPERGASAMARALGIDRVTCQRIVGAVARVEAGPQTLVQLPGIQGLRQFTQAMRKRSGSRAHAEQLAAADAAIDRFESLLRELGGSQRQLRARITADGIVGPPLAPPDHDSAREALFNAAAAVTGRSTQTLIDIRIARPAPADPGLTEGLRVRGYLGHAFADEALPLEMFGSAPLQARTSGPAFLPLDTGADTPLLAEFCSRPLPRMMTRSAGDRVFQLIEPDPEAPHAPMDIVTAHRAAQPDIHPAAMRPAIGEMWTLITFPARRLVYDVFLHRDIARRCIPSMEVHLRGYDTHPLGARRWSTRFPGAQRLEVLSHGIEQADTPTFDRHQGLLAHAFARAGWDPSEFVGFRSEVFCPVWRAGYCMVFDFTGNEMPERHS